MGCPSEPLTTQDQNTPQLRSPSQSQGQDTPQMGCPSEHLTIQDQNTPQSQGQDTPQMGRPSENLTTQDQNTPQLGEKRQTPYYLRTPHVKETDQSQDKTTTQTE